jgi:hypothetical protein
MREYTDQEIRSELYGMWQELGQQRQHRNGKTDWRASNEESAASHIRIIPFANIGSTKQTDEKSGEPLR